MKNGHIVVTRPAPDKQGKLPVFDNDVNKRIGDIVREAINETSRYALTAENLLTPDNQNKIVEIATEKSRKSGWKIPNYRLNRWLTSKKRPSAIRKASSN